CFAFPPAATRPTSWRRWRKPGSSGIRASRFSARTEAGPRGLPHGSSSFRSKRQRSSKRHILPSCTTSAPGSMLRWSTVEQLSREIGEPSGNEIIANGSHKSGALAYILGLDIGGTKTAAVLATAAGRVLDRFEVATRPEEGFAASFARVRAVGEAVCRRAQAAGVEISHIGVSIGGPLDVERGVIYSPPNLPGWDAVPLKELLEEHFGLPVVVEHDGMAGALAEHRFGAGRGLKHLIFLTLGTGLG